MIDVRLSREIEVGAKARPRYKTDKINADGGYVVRNQRWRYPLFDFEFTIEPGYIDEGDYVEDPAEIEKLEEFIRLFHVVGGAGSPFPFRHWRDYQALDQPLGYGDYSQTEYQLYRSYTLGAVTRRRKILLPVVNSLVAYVDGAPTAATVNRGTGILTFALPPDGGQVITADFDFDVPVCFASDEIEMIALSDVLDQPASITLEEVRAL